MNCEKCGITIDGKFGSGRFCSKKCSNSRPFTEKRRNENSRWAKNNPRGFCTEEWKSTDKISKRISEGILKKLSPEERKFRSNILGKRGTRTHCEFCNKTKNIDTHHLDGNKFNNSLDNLLNLCRSCHVKYHQKYGTKNGKFGISKVGRLSQDKIKEIMNEIKGS